MKTLLIVVGLVLTMLSKYFALLDVGLVSVFSFLGLTMIAGSVSLFIFPVLDRMIGENSKSYYLQQYQNHIKRQEDAFKRVQEEILQGQQKKYSNK